MMMTPIGSVSSWLAWRQARAPMGRGAGWMPVAEV
jgi:hypothetical protein